MKELNMAINREDILEFNKNIIELFEENRKFKNGFIQSFKTIYYEECPICYNRECVIFPYPSLKKPFRYIYIYGCKQCGISYVKKDDLDLSIYYADEYAKVNRRDRNISPDLYFQKENINKLSHYFLRAERHKFNINMIMKNINSILDFGSGPGYFLYGINSNTKYAIEPDINSHKYLDYINAKIINTYDNLKFDVIYASHSLEHLYIHELSRLLSSFSCRLNENGVFFGEVPCGNILRFPLYYRHDPHTIFFTMQSLYLSLVNNGFKSVHIFPFNPNKKSRPRDDAQYKPSMYEQHDYTGTINFIASNVIDDARLFNNIDNFICD